VRAALAEPWPELDVVLQQSACSVLLLEKAVLKKDFATILTGLEPAVASAAPGEIVSLRYPFLRHVALVDGDEGRGAIEGWSAFLARGDDVSEELVDARAGAVAPSQSTMRPSMANSSASKIASTAESSASCRM
jgi:fatty-acyl-CoA synthase